MNDCTYPQRLVQCLAPLFYLPGTAERIAAQLPEVLALLSLDLEPARASLQACYADPARGGKPERDPVAMLRCFVLMLLCGQTSITKWVKTLRGHPELTVLSGFAVGDAPGIGTIYDFCKRLCDGPYQKPCAHVHKPSQRLKATRGRFRRHLKREKALAKKQAELAMANEGRVQHEVRLAQQDMASPPRLDFQGRLNEILFRCGVVPSAQAGLLGRLDRLVVAGDGSPLESGAHHWGKAQCDCHRQGIKHCDCDRIYSDPHATIGYDSYRERYLLGFRLHCLVTIAAGVELPLHLAVTAAHVPDVVTAVDATTQLFKLLRSHLPEAHIRYGLLDAGYDATWFYRHLLALGTYPLIPLAQQVTTPQDGNGIARNADGIPLCPGGAAMWRHSYDQRTGKIVYGCPAKRPGRDHGKGCIKVDISRCPHGQLCEPASKMGPLVRVSVDEDPRLNPPIDRNSPHFKDLFKSRTAAERYFANGKGRAGLGRRPWRRDYLFAIGSLAHALGCHGLARVRHGNIAGLPSNAADLLSWLEAQCASPLAQAA